MERKSPGDSSFFWKSMVKASEVFRKGLVVNIGNGESTNFWEDPWIVWHGKPTSLKDLGEVVKDIEIKFKDFIIPMLPCGILRG
ncbi:hypothetical protein FRX31_011095 [Thalictrum thalictroides]|uniref:Uncharacterized protein n=1 Tax=Thalictrum thalictroides TaxID=46969 RepID=A0A7J6WQX1_THATH|nr:hypothetical protein FRX31_011095 [Thalictrum thalictroides]